MAKSRKELVSAIIREKFKREYPEDLTNEFQDVLLDDNFVEEKTEALEEEWYKMKECNPDMTDYKSLDRSKQKIGLRGATMYRNFIIKRVAAAVVIPLILISGGVLLFDKGNNAPEPVYVEVAINVQNGETKRALLNDSTEVWVNSGSRFKFTENGSERLVELNGESYFNVARDEKRPFVVKTRFAKITVVGTEFNVEAYDDRDLTMITLDAGKVGVSVENQPLCYLKPGEQFIYNSKTRESEIVEIHDTNLGNASGWITGNIVCYKMTVDNMVNAIERRFNTKIIVDDKVHFGNKTYITEFLAGSSLDDVMNLLKVMVGGFEYKIENNKVEIYTK